MAHTLDLSSARLQTGAVRGSVLHQAMGKLDFSRIAAESGAIAVHVAALMLLLAPMSVPPAPTAEEELPPFIIEPVRKVPPPPPPPISVQVRTPTRTTPQVVQPAHVERPPIEVADATLVDLPPLPPVADEGLDRTDTIAPPLAGAHLEYEIAPPPRYTAEMMRAQMQGTVLLRVLVDIDGKPLQVTIERSSGHRQLDAAAQRQVLGKWRFKPAMQDGQSVQAIGMVPVNFTLN